MALTPSSVQTLSALTLSAFLTLVTLAGCNKEPPTSAGPGTAVPPSAAPASPPSGGAGGGVADDPLVGKPAPAFHVTASDGTEIDPAKLKGKPLVVYFYPKDETPGCTKEACAFRDAWDKLSAKGVVLVGVSGDSDESHKTFAAHHKLPFHLVSDDGKLATAFGVPTFGRQSFVVGADGRVKKVYRRVDVGEHAAQILSDVGP